MKKLQLLTMLLLLTGSVTFAADIHVYAGGSIQNAVNSAASGDRVVIHAGTYSQVVSMGNRSNLTITSAGDGEVIIQGNGTDGATFWIQNCSSITISNLTIKNTRKQVWSTGITVIGSGSNIQILGNKLTDISYRSGAFDPSDNPDNHGAQFQGVNAISVVGDNANASYSNIVIRNNEVSYCMTGWSEAIALKGNVDGFTVDNNHVHHITNIGIDAFGLGTYPNITTNNQARNGTIINNDVHHCICNYTDNGAIYVDGGVNISIMNNKVYNSKYGITIGCENQIVKPGGATENIEVRNNLVYNNSRAGIMVGTGGDDDGQQGITRFCRITGNTFLKNATGDIWAGEFMLQNANNIEFYNNIFYGLYGRIGTVNNGSVSNTFGNNIFFSGSGVTIDFSKQTGTSTWISQTFAQFKADHNDNSSTSQDPQLVNANVSSLNAHLQSSSPAINAGKANFTTISGEKDLDGQARIFGGTVDIGVDESGSTGTISVTGVSSTPSSASIVVGATQQLTATISPSNATNQNRTWSSNNTSVATVNSSGLVTAVAAGSATITVTTQDGNFTDTSVITVTSSGGSLPSPWVTANIGAVGATGSAGHSSGTFTVAGSGADIWGTADEFRYVYQSVSGDVTITARVASLGNTDPWAKAGVMIRESTGATVRHAMTAVSSANGLAFQRRTTSGGQSVHTAGPSGAAPYWVRLTRSGNVFTSFVSTNGTSWSQVGSETIAMPSGALVGLAVTSHNDGTLCTATFDNVSVTTGSVAVTGVSVSPTSTSLSVGSTQQLNATISPSNASNQNRTWSSSNTSVATVNSSGLVTAVAAGNATITVTTQQGGFTANCSVTVTSGGNNITVNGNLSDWSSISAVAIASGQTSTSLKVYSNSTTLYFGVAGSGMNATDYQIFINTDNNTGTGYQDSQFASSGADYMIENGTLYVSTGTGWGWNFVTATIQASKNTSVTELSVNRSAFSSLNSTIRVAYKDIANWTAVSRLPSSGGYAAYTLGSARAATDEAINAYAETAESKVTLYPNPTKGKTVQVNYSVPFNALVKLVVQDAKGGEAKVLELGVKEPGEYSEQIETSSLREGLYFIRVSVGNQIKTLKLVHN